MIRSLSPAIRAILASLAAFASLSRARPIEARQRDTDSGATITRDAQGRATVRAVRLTQPLRLDGQLDDAIYRTVTPASDFVETEPSNGSPARERTEIWVFFDDDNVYVAARCWENDGDRRVANEMRRDNGGVLRGDHFAVSLDTFFDRRSAVVLNINPIGGRMDGQVAAEGQYNGDWNPVWKVETGTFDHGWTVEAAFPFKTLRYRPGREQTWGINARRRVIANNEIAYLSPVPAGTALNGTTRPSTFGTLVGLQAPPLSRNIELKPFTVGALSSDRTSTPRVNDKFDGDIGLDAKYGITQNLTANFTVNTDFAQVEADEQQVNLTRFSLFFPEKREFFLENYGLFGFGGVAPTSAAGDVPILFYSRRIGLNNGREVPIHAGGRVVGQLGRFTLGAINMQTGDKPEAGAVSTNFTSLRLKRDILRRSNVGLIFTNRSVTQDGRTNSQTYGADATFGFFANLSINTYWAQTESGAHNAGNRSYRGQFNYNGDRYGLVAERLVVGSGFNPEVGFVRRPDLRKSYGQLRFSPRPQHIPKVRKLTYSGTWWRIDNNAGRRETEFAEGLFGGEFRNTDTFEMAYNSNYEFLPRPFNIAPGFVIPVGGYDTNTVRGAYNFGRQRPLSGNVTAQYGTFYTGHLTSLGVAQGRINVTNQMSVEPTMTINWVDLAQGSFTQELFGSRVTYTMTPRMFVSALLQYNSSTDTTSTNVRLRWEYQPGSEFFVVYNETRDTLAPGFPDMTNRALIVKLNRLMAF